MRLTIALTWGAALAVAAMLGVWAAAPRPGPFAPPDVFARNAADPAAVSEAAPLNVDAFAVNLWRDPPAAVAAQPAAAPEPTPTAKTLQLELLGITRHDALLQANLYDSRDDRIVVVGEGDRVRRFTVRRITRDAIEVSDGDRTYTLALEEDPA